MMMKNRSNCVVFLLIVQVFSILRTADTLSTQPTSTTKLRNSRFVCLLDDYSTVRGPYFNALFDQLLQEQCGIQKRRIALCTSESNADKTRELMPQLEEDLLLDNKHDCCNLFVLNDYNPLSLQDDMAQFDPSIFWLVDDNAFRIRYQLRTSGMDGILHQKCGGPAPSNDSSSSNSNCLYVGEHAGAVCAGASLATAHAMNQDPKQAPEPQYFGLHLLGPSRSISFGLSNSELTVHPRTYDIDPSTLVALERDQVFVWSQPPDEDTTSFVFLPSKRGTIEQWESPPPIPALIEDGNNQNSIGVVQCDGEPSIDPSRMMQQVGDSEWINEVDDAI
jgi:hypothetical protein